MKNSTPFILLIAAAVLGVAAVVAQAPVAQKGGTQAPLVSASDTGSELYEQHCAACHGAGPGHPGTQALAIKYKGSEPAVLTERKDVTADYVRAVVRNGIASMPYFRKTELSDRQLDLIAQRLSRANSERAR
jgi:mono/diheme cytochrome c family protein